MTGWLHQSKRLMINIVWINISQRVIPSLSVSADSIIGGSEVNDRWILIPVFQIVVAFPGGRDNPSANAGHRKQRRSSNRATVRQASKYLGRVAPLAAPERRAVFL